MKHLLLSIFTLITSLSVYSIPGDSLRTILSSDAYLQKVRLIEEQTVIPVEDYDIDNTPGSEISDSVFIARIQSIPSIVNLPYNDKIRTLIERYVIKYPDQVQALLARSDYYFPLFEEVFDAYNLPQELKYLAVIESALKPQALSRVGAGGLWQFMRATGKMYGLQIDSNIDERSDPIKSTQAAAKFLSDLYDMFDDWTLALAAYNCGPGNVKKAIRKAGGKSDFWKIYNFLPRETRSYVPVFVAATYTFNYYAAHGITRVAGVSPMLVDTVQIDQRLHFMQLAEVLNISIDTLRALNPQVKQDFIPQLAKPFKLVLPYDKAYEFCGNENLIYTWKDSVYFNAKFIKNTAVTSIDVKDKSKVSYTVKSGDTVGAIADWYNVRVADIRSWNNLRGNTIRVGQKLQIYVPVSKVNLYNEINKLSFKEKQNKYS